MQTLLALVVIAGALSGTSGDFPEIEEPGIVEDGAADSTQEPIVNPDNDLPGQHWGEKAIRPRDVTPAAAQPNPTPAPAQSITVQSNTATPPTRPVERSVLKAPASRVGPIISGYHGASWGESKEQVQRIFGSDRPLLERGEGKWLISDQCEGQKALIAFRFGSQNQLNQVVCLFKQGIDLAEPDAALYQKLRDVLTSRWGMPTATNETPDPEASRAAEWEGPAGKAVLIFDPAASSVQLTVEGKNLGS